MKKRIRLLKSENTQGVIFTYLLTCLLTYLLVDF